MENLIENQNMNPEKLAKAFHNEIPQTSFLATMEVSRWSVEMFLACLESDVRIWSEFTSETAQARYRLAKHHLEMAQNLFGIEKVKEVSNV